MINLHADPRQKEPCPDCGHRWFAHHRAGGPTGGKCLYMNQCSCTMLNPAYRDEDDLARVSWNLFMGRDVSNAGHPPPR